MYSHKDTYLVRVYYLDGGDTTTDFLELETAKRFAASRREDAGVREVTITKIDAP